MNLRRESILGFDCKFNFLPDFLFRRYETKRKINRQQKDTVQQKRELFLFDFRTSKKKKVRLKIEMCSKQKGKESRRTLSAFSLDSTYENLHTCVLSRLTFLIFFLFQHFWNVYATTSKHRKWDLSQQGCDRREGGKVVA